MVLAISVLPSPGTPSMRNGRGRAGPPAGGRGLFLADDHTADLLPQPLAGLAQLGHGLDVFVAWFRRLLALSVRHVQNSSLFVNRRCGPCSFPRILPDRERHNRLSCELAVGAVVFLSFDCRPFCPARRLGPLAADLIAVIVQQRMLGRRSLVGREPSVDQLLPAAERPPIPKPSRLRLGQLLRPFAGKPRRVRGKLGFIHSSSAVVAVITMRPFAESARRSLPDAAVVTPKTCSRQVIPRTASPARLRAGRARGKCRNVCPPRSLACPRMITHSRPPARDPFAEWPSLPVRSLRAWRRLLSGSARRSPRTHDVHAGIRNAEAFRQPLPAKCAPIR